MVKKKFKVNGVPWIIIQFENVTHVMPEEEWRRAYGRLHPERWSDENF